jgi:hypothetical protein
VQLREIHYYEVLRSYVISTPPAVGRPGPPAWTGYNFSAARNEPHRCFRSSAAANASTSQKTVERQPQAHSSFWLIQSGFVVAEWQPS